MTSDVEVKFDFESFGNAIRDLAKLKEINKAAKTAMKTKEGIAELALLSTAIEYGIKDFDLHPLAIFVSLAKPSAIAKRAIKAIFPTFEYALVGDAKRPSFIHIEGQSKVYDTAKAQVIFDSAASGDGMTCEQVKLAFPAADLAKDAKLAKIEKALKARMKSDGLTKADLLELVKGLA